MKPAKVSPLFLIIAAIEFITGLFILFFIGRLPEFLILTGSAVIFAGLFGLQYLDAKYSSAYDLGKSLLKFHADIFSMYAENVGPATIDMKETGIVMSYENGRKCKVLYDNLKGVDIEPSDGERKTAILDEDGSDAGLQIIFDNKGKAYLKGLSKVLAMKNVSVTGI